MRQPTWGPIVKDRVKLFLEILLSVADGVNDSDDFHFRWEDNIRTSLIIETKRRYLQKLTQLKQRQIYEVIESLKSLEILEDNRTQTQGKEDWRFTLRLWNRDIANNLSHFDQKWETKRPAKSKIQVAALQKASELKQQCISPMDKPIVTPAALNLKSGKKLSFLGNTELTLPDSPIMSTNTNRYSFIKPEAEFPVGQVPLESVFYVERPFVEERCYHEILQPASLIRIKAPRLMGKTSLMARILHQARTHGYDTVPLNFELADSAVFANLDTFLRWFCESVGRRLKKLEQLDDYWVSYGSKDKTTAYFEECLLEEITNPLVITLDGVEQIFPHRKVADDFFSLLRAWYEYARYGDLISEVWKKLRLVIVHSSEVYIPLDINQSPFNVGLSIELQEFTKEQVQDLSIRHALLNWTNAQVDDLMSMIGGHPYLVRLAMYHIQNQEITLENLLQTASTEAGIYSDHLRRHLWNLKQHPDLAAAFNQVVSTAEPVELNSDLVFKLHSMGLVLHCYENKVTWRCNLYRQYFSQRLN
ncbi:AAA-like domain-containing protein [Nostoc sp. FACHB-110]|uniref:AAA-like domain-containing protein n=1 Tax=Nostoc sp. FACHB-110 TaxID=2692834 RepID=UPI0016854938|nr:AAA-like domain-containing protein [Nostoc sp. FACHB-110]MBD2441519.1 AAA-like domain-containing protein [Nostoc sp. FACHB-110]